MPTHSLTIIIPAYNEADAISPTLDQILHIMESRSLKNFEVLVFDDASTDRTGSIAEEYAKKHAHVRVFRNPKNSGMGYSYKEGVKAAANEYLMPVHAITNAAVR